LAKAINVQSLLNPSHYNYLEGNRSKNKSACSSFTSLKSYKNNRAKFTIIISGYPRLKNPSITLFSLEKVQKEKVYKKGRKPENKK
jgi:hypothetical protein